MSNPDPIVIHLQAKDDGVNEVFDSATRAAEKQKKALNDTMRRMKEYHRTLGMTKQELEIYKLRQNGATEAQIRAATRIAKLTELKQKDIATNKRLNGSLRMIRGGFGQVGHQIQDVAIQAQMGTDAFIILGQQGSQVASLFGPGGAALGAFLAVGAALYTSFKPAVDDSRESLESIIKSTKDQIVELGLLTEAQKEFQSALKAQTVEEATENNEKLNKQLEEQTARLGRAQKGYDEAVKMSLIYNQGVLKSTVETRAFGDALKDIERDIKATKSAMDDNQAVIDQYTNGTITAAEKEKERKKSLEDLVKGIEDQANAITKTAEARAYAEAVEKGATAQELRRIALAFAAIEREKEKQKRLRETARQEAQEQAAREKQANAEQKRLDNLIKSVSDFSIGRKGVLEKAFEAELALLQQASLDAVGTEANRNSLIEALRRRHKDNLDKIDGKKPEKKEEDDEDKKQQKLIQDIKNLQKLRQQAIQGIKDERTVFEEAQIAKIAAIQAAAQAEIISETEKKEALNALRQADLENQLDAQLKLVGGLQHLEDSAEQAMMQFITQGQSASEAMRMLGRSIMDELLKSIIKMGIERVKQAVIAKQVESGALSSSVMANAAAMAKIGAAAATPAALVATATAGGAAAAGAAGLTSTVGLAQALAAAGGSFDGGGFTGMGSRSGGIDGRGGFPAILHPNETVIDHTRGQGQGITIINNIDASGNQDVDEKIAIAVTQSSRQTVEQVHNMMRRGRM